MNPNFDVNTSFYPIGCLLNGSATTSGPSYDIVDMRDLEVICKTIYTMQQLEDVCAKLNANLRAGKYEDNYDDIKKDAEILLGYSEATEIVMPEALIDYAAPVEPTPTEQVSTALATLAEAPKFIDELNPIPSI